MDQAVTQVFASRRRGPRYAVESPVRFWTSDSETGEGTTVNVSRLGMLFRTTESATPAPSSVIQIRMALSTGGWHGAYVACTGRVVRAVRAPFPGEVYVATTIEESAIRPALNRSAPLMDGARAEGTPLFHALEAKEVEPRLYEGGKVSAQAPLDERHGTYERRLQDRAAARASVIDR